MTAHDHENTIFCRSKLRPRSTVRSMHSDTVGFMYRVHSEIACTVRSRHNKTVGFMYRVHVHSEIACTVRSRHSEIQAQ